MALLQPPKQTRNLVVRQHEPIKPFGANSQVGYNPALVHAHGASSNDHALR